MTNKGLVSSSYSGAGGGKGSRAFVSQYQLSEQAPARTKVREG